jgi:hypothetical protein
MRSAENRIVRPTAAGMNRVESTASGLATKTARSGRCNGVDPAQRTDPDWRERAAANSSYSPYSPVAWAALTTVALLALSSLTAAHDRVPKPPPAFPTEPITTRGSTAVIPKLASVSLSGPAPSHRAVPASNCSLALSSSIGIPTRRAGYLDLIRGLLSIMRPASRAGEHAASLELPTGEVRWRPS